jgi:DNA-binding NtrC family response regulator
MSCSLPALYALTPVRLFGKPDRTPDHFVDSTTGRGGTEMSKRIRSVDKRTAQLLDAYQWPGNIRELQNVIQRAVILCGAEVFSVEEGWFRSTPEADMMPLPPHSIEEEERIESALEKSRGRISGPRGAATRLGIPRTTLEAKIKRLTINK